LQSRDWCRGWFIAGIGDGTSTSLWYDYWLLEGKRLIDILPLRTLTSMGLSWTAKVSDIICRGQWHFPVSQPALQVIWDSIHFQPCQSVADYCIWKGHTSGKFSIASAWEIIREIRPTTSMHHLLWFKGHIPRQSFILWLACMGRLRTMDRLHSTGTITNHTCILCGLYMETHEHLFFDCSFTGTVWRSINTRANLQWPHPSWQELLQWASTHYRKHNDFKHMVPRLLLSTTIYLLWHERNNRVFSNQHRNAQTIMEEIYQLIRTHLTHMEHAARIPDSVCTIWRLRDN